MFFLDIPPDPPVEVPVLVVQASYSKRGNIVMQDPAHMTPHTRKANKKGEILRHLLKYQPKFIWLTLLVIPFLTSCLDMIVKPSQITPDISNAIAACTAASDEKLRGTFTAKTPKTAPDISIEVQRIQKGGEVNFGSDSEVSLKKYQAYLECLDKRLNKKLKVADDPCHDRICVDIVREADFSKSGCNPDGTKRDIVVYSDTITLSRDESQYTAQAIRLKGMDVQLFDLNNSNHILVPTVYARANNDLEMEPLYWNLPVKEQTVKFQTVWNNANLTDPGIGFSNKYMIRNINATIKLPPGIAIQPETMNAANPEDAMKCTLQPTISCRNLLVDHGVDILWKWNMWENCSKSAAPKSALKHISKDLKKASSDNVQQVNSEPKVVVQQNPQSTEQQDNLNLNHIENNAKSISNMIKSGVNNFENLDGIYFIFDSSALNVSVENNKAIILRGRGIDLTEKEPIGLICSGTPPYPAKLSIELLHSSDTEVSKSYRELLVAVKSIVANDENWSYSNLDQFSFYAKSKYIRIGIYRSKPDRLNDKEGSNSNLKISMYASTDSRNVNDRCNEFNFYDYLKLPVLLDP